METNRAPIRRTNFVVESDVEERGEEHADKIQKRQISEGERCEAYLRVLAAGSAIGMGEQRMADGLPVFGLQIGVARGLQEDGRKKEEDNHTRQRENQDREDQQLFVPGDDREGTLEQQPAPSKLAHFVHGVSFLRLNVVSPRRLITNLPAVTKPDKG